MTQADKSPIRTAIVLAGGWGTRFLPFTKAVPKEMLPVAGVPAIQHVVEECLAAGIERITVVTRPGCDVTRRHFAPAPLLDAYLQRQGHARERESIDTGAMAARLRFVEERAELGYGNAVPLLQLKTELLQEQAFALLFADDLVLGGRPAIGELIDAHARHGAAAAIAMQRVPRAQLGQFGNLALGPRIDGDGPHSRPVHDLVQRPRPEQIRSPYAVVSRLILGPSIFELLDTSAARGELDVGVAVARQARAMPVIGVELSGRWVTVGDPAHYERALRVAARLRIARPPGGSVGAR